VVGELLLNHLLVAHQNNFVPQLFFGQERPFDIDGQAPIATHGVQGDANGHGMEKLTKPYLPSSFFLGAFGATTSSLP
jgi:hypothetical protein